MRRCKPHARGDGPKGMDEAQITGTVNPTHVGMDRSSAPALLPGTSKPHMRGEWVFLQASFETRRLEHWR